VRALSIGEVARAAGVQPSAVRYYERKGLLPVPDRVAGRRRYGPDVLELLRVIEVSKAAGFTLAEIERLMHGFDSKTPPSERWRSLAEDKLREVDAVIERAQRMRALLQRGVECGCLTVADCELLHTTPVS
jgi:MerR family transcriptional regulator, redox-sensitive transcriptional activator SoxR